MLPNPVTIIIRSNSTSQFQETNGLLYCIRQGDQVFYTAIVEKENIHSAGFQELSNGVSPLQLIMEMQQKTRKKAEQIADKIIEEIILQKSKQQQASKVLNEQRRELTMLADDISQKNMNYTNNGNVASNLASQYYLQPMQALGESRSMTMLQRDASTSSLDYFMKRSNSQNQIPNQMPMQQMNSNISSKTYSSYAQRKNELISKIGSQIERNIKEEQNNLPSYDNISLSSRVTPKGGVNLAQSALTGGSPKLNELRNLNKSRNQSISPQKSGVAQNKWSNNNYNNPDERVETDISVTSNNNTVSNYNSQQMPPLLNLNPNPDGNYNQFDIKEYMKQAILNPLKTPPQNSRNQTEMTEQTPAFHGIHQPIQQHGHSQFIQSLQHIETQISQKDAQGQARGQQVNSPSSNNNIGDQKSFTETYPMQSQQGEGSVMSQNYSDQKMMMLKKSNSKIGLTQRNVERDKLKKANAETESRLKQKSSSNLKKNDESSPQTSESQQTKADPQGASIGDFISKINSMLQKSANINAQVEQSMLDSQRNLQQLNNNMSHRSQRSQKE